MRVVKVIMLIAFLLFVYFNDATFTNMSNYKATKIKVELKGEVSNPGVYTMKSKDTIETLLIKAGNELESADMSSVNKTKQLIHGDIIHIPKQQTKEKVSINSANLEKLQTLHGVGVATAQRIIDYREQHGSFQVIEDIMKVAGIKEKLFAKIKDSISL